ncbi:hypothetical protein ELQ90_13955 [Labedella phragmitis]|uniref:Integral membrane protein n=1 Tax=Labedella phragmitis TaxID=2498849 RepID=A0A3S4AEH6_9MICO|nr:hypothetical protein [Labedella phragmitis]RWZ46549.1 hypothetical protein ELQ90_13955 [Labedella phragmitis]
MIEWLTVAQVAVAIVAGLLCLVVGLAGRRPSDLTLGATALVELLLLVQLVVSIVSPAAGNTPTGDALEFGLYLGSAILLPVGAGFWALVDRSKWATVILGVANLAIAVMVYRMHEIWFVQGG